MDRELRIEQRKAHDAERGKLRACDEKYGTSKLLNWTLATFSEEYSMPRGRPPGSSNKAKANEQASSLLAALNFIEPASDSSDQFYKAHVRFENNFAIAYDGQLAAGHPIVEVIEATPNLEKLKKAIARCGKTLAIATTSNTQLSVKGESFRALIPCLGMDNLPEVVPDPPEYQANDELKEAFKTCGVISVESSNDFIVASLLLNNQVCTSSNRAAMLQYWHGINMPPGIVIPKVFAAAVAKTTHKLTAFGFSWSPADSNGEYIPASLTFWFENGAWFKTQCYNDRWPDVDRILNMKSFPLETPSGLFEAIGAVADFNENGIVTFGDDKVMSHLNPDYAEAVQDLKGIQSGKQFNGKLAKQVLGFAKTIDLTTYEDRALFFTDTKIRGVIMCCKSDK